MSDQAEGPGWWLAADRKWYPPHLHPEFVAPEPPDEQDPWWVRVALKPAVWLAVVALFFVGLWLNTRNDLDDARGRLDAIAAEEAARPDLAALADQHDLASYASQQSSTAVTVTFFAGLPGTLRGFLSDCGFNAGAVIERMGHTRALDGTQRAESDHVVATWTYHPDNGLSVVFEVIA